MTENPALYLASRQKRLTYWVSRFRTESLDAAQKTMVENLLKTYNSTIATAAREENPEAQQPLFEQLQTLDRELSTLFEQRRLLTSEHGIACLTDYSTRGKGGSAT
jgi:hypothetical protein